MSKHTPQRKAAIRAAVAALQNYAIWAEHPNQWGNVREGYEALLPYISDDPLVASWFEHACRLIDDTLREMP